MDNPIFKRDILIRQKVEKDIKKFIIQNNKENVLHMTEYDDYVSIITSLPEDYLCTDDEIMLKNKLFGLFLKYRIMEDEKGLDISLNNKKTPVTVVKTSRSKSINESYLFRPIVNKITRSNSTNEPYVSKPIYRPIRSISAMAFGKKKS